MPKIFMENMIKRNVLTATSDPFNSSNQRDEMLAGICKFYLRSFIWYF